MILNPDMNDYVAMKAKRKLKMKNTINRVNVLLHNAENNQCCPECGGNMKEVERNTEGYVTYVRFECVKAYCDGQWLQPYSNNMLRQSG